MAICYEDGQHYVKNPETYPMLRFIVEVYSRLGAAKLQNILTVKVYHPRGKRWHSNSIKTIVNNPVYLGITMYNVTTTVKTADGKRRLVVRPRKNGL